MSSSALVKAKTAAKRSFKPVDVRSTERAERTDGQAKSAPMLMNYWFVFVATALAAMFFFAQMELLTSITNSIADGLNTSAVNMLQEIGQIVSGEFIDSLRRFMPPLPTLPKLPF